LLYWTAAVSEDGSLVFPPDRYGRDQVLIDALNAPRDSSNAVFAQVSPSAGS
jgi:murein L,D-transpeptidase YcbB/YkuD